MTIIVTPEHLEKLAFPHYKISTKAKYFISVRKYAEHSYVIAGCDNSDAMRSEYPRIFSATGKIYDQDGCTYLKGLTSYAQANYGDEPLIRRKCSRSGGKVASVTYQAYEISYDQYLEYIRLLHAVNEKKRWQYYMTIDVNGEKVAVCSRDFFGLEENPIKAVNLTENQKKAFSLIGFTNTCRNAARTVLEYLKIKFTGISQFWFRSMPHEMKIRNGKIITPLFILPIPPDVAMQSEHPRLYGTLKYLNDNIVKLSQTNYGLDLARRKINVMRELYNKLRALKSDAEMSRAAGIIQGWKHERHDNNEMSNAELINQSRTSFLRFSLFNPARTHSTHVIDNLLDVSLGNSL